MKQRALLDWTGRVCWLGWSSVGIGGLDWGKTCSEVGVAMDSWISSVAIVVVVDEGVDVRGWFVEAEEGMAGSIGFSAFRNNWYNKLFIIQY